MNINRWFYLIAIIVVIIIAILSFLFVQHKKEDKQSVNETKSINKDIHIAIVNEDKPVKYNGKQIELGKAFIEKLSKENTHTFETVNRNIAENGMKNGSYQVMVIIPKDFSELGMQLDKKTPAKMSIQYKTAAGQNEKITREVEEVVSNVLNTFNKNLINIYFSSVIDNLHNAQKNVGEMIKRQDGTDHLFQTYLLNPLNDFPQNFTDLMVNSITANNEITNLITGYNHSILNKDNSYFNINKTAREIVEQQNSSYTNERTILERTIEDYKNKSNSVDISGQIESLEKLDGQYTQKIDSAIKDKDEYKSNFETNLDRIRKDIESEESPFTDDMIKDYRQKLTESLNEKLDNNSELNSFKEEIEKNNQNLKAVFITNMVNTIQKDEKENDDTFIPKISEENVASMGLSNNQIDKYKLIIQHLNTFKDEYNQQNPDKELKQEPYEEGLKAQYTDKLVTDGVKFKRDELIKSKDINSLTIATDKNFDYEGKVKIEDQEYDIKNQDILLNTDVKNYKVTVEGVARLKNNDENKQAFLNDPTMHLQLLFGQVDKSEVANNNDPKAPATKSNNIESEANSQEASNGTEDKLKDKDSTNVIDISLNHNLKSELISPELSQQLSALEKFETQWQLYNESNVNQLKPTIDNKSIVEIMVNQVTDDMTAFKKDKADLLKEIDGLKDTSDDIAENMSDQNEWLSTTEKDISGLIEKLKKEDEKLNGKIEDPKVESKKDNEFTTLSMELDSEVQKLSERSAEVLSDSQSTKSSAESVSSKINQLDTHVNSLHASGRALGTRANDLNKQMVSNAKQNDLFTKNFEQVLKNSKDGDKQNEALKDFMSNPIKKKNLENVLANNNDKHTISPSLMILLMYLLSIMTAYFINNYLSANSTFGLWKNDFSQNNQYYNKLMTSLIITSIGAAEGLIIALFALNKYSLLPGYRLKFLCMVIVTMVVFVLLNTYLLRQIKTIGMFIILCVLGLYLIAMNEWTGNKVELTLSVISPLSYIDTMFFNYLNAEHPVGLMLFFLCILALIGFGLNFVVKKLEKVRLL